MEYYNKAIDLNLDNYAAWYAKKELLFSLEDFQRAFLAKHNMSVIFGDQY
jgi:hypothetical protein